MGIIDQLSDSRGGDQPESPNYHQNAPRPPREPRTPPLHKARTLAALTGLPSSHSYSELLSEEFRSPFFFGPDGETLKDDEGHKAARARRLARLTSEDSHRRTAASATASGFASGSVPAAHALAGQERPSEATALHESARPVLEITTPPETVVTRPASA